MLSGHIALAHVHAILATVPQAQFDAWKPAPTLDHGPKPGTDVYCILCGRALFTTDPQGRITRLAGVAGWSLSDGKPMCHDDDEGGCRGMGPAIRPRRRSVPEPARFHHSRLQIGDDTPCPHGRSESRCLFCHDEAPTTRCASCTTPCWSPTREVGSRCGLRGCAGLMIQWGTP